MEKLTTEQQEYLRRQDGFLNLVFMVDTNGEAIYYSRAFEKYTGVPLHKDLRFSWQNVCHPDDLEAISIEFFNAFYAKVQFCSQYRLRKFDGSYNVVFVFGEPFYSIDGKFLGYVGTSAEMSELNGLKVNLESEKSRLEAILKNSPDHIMQINHSGQIISVNKLHSLSFIEDLLGQNINDKTNNPIALLFQSLTTQAQSSYTTLEVCFIHKVSDRNRYFHCRVAPFRFGPDQSILVSTTDITERVIQSLLEKENRAYVEDQKYKLAHKSQLASLGELSTSLAHELVNPLTIFSGHIEQLKAKIQSNTYCNKDYMNHIRALERNLERLIKISKGLSHFARDVSNDPLALVSVNQILWETLEFMGMKIRKHDISLVVGTFDDIKIECQDVKISQVLVNLITNAVQAISDLPEKWIKIDVRDLGETIQISVKDSGLGIPADKQRLIFSPFFTSKPSRVGTGLGLSISQKILMSHHGRLRLDTETINTCFLMELPKKQPIAGSSSVPHFSNRKNYFQEIPI